MYLKAARTASVIDTQHLSPECSLTPGLGLAGAEGSRKVTGSRKGQVWNEMRKNYYERH